METKTKSILFFALLIVLVLLAVLFPGLITVDNGQWAAIFLLWLGCLCLENQLTKSEFEVEPQTLRVRHLRSILATSESFLINDARGNRWIECGFHPLTAGVGEPALTVYDGKGGTMLYLSITKLAKLLQTLDQEIEKLEQIETRKEEEFISDLLED